MRDHNEPVANLLNPSSLIETGGTLLIGAVVFAESGLLLGFFLPGDTLLLSAGFFAAEGQLNFPVLLVVVVIAAITGDNLGYHIGRHTSRRILKRRTSRLFSSDRLAKAERFYEAHGGKTIILARFVPIVRTCVPMLAGMTNMNYRRFMLYNVVGALIWGVGLTSLGYLLAVVVGHYLDLEKYLLLAVAVAITLTFGGTIYHLARDWWQTKRANRKGSAGN